MQTTSHVMINLALLGRLTGWRYAWALMLGGLLPDVSMFGFFAIQTVILGNGGHIIWDEMYFDPFWQIFFDIPHSFVVIGVLCALAFWRRWHWVFWLAAGMGLHAVADFFVHREDAHHHFWPLSSYQFISPVSYWDPAHYGRQFHAFELALLVVLSIYVWRRWPSRVVRTVVALLLFVTFGMRLLFLF